MAFNDQEISTEGGAPIELYKIEGEDVFYYTSSATEFTFEGNTYTPVAMSRSGPVISENTTSGGLTIKFPFNDPFVSRYLRGTPPSPDRVTIYQVHLSDAAQEVRPFWSGMVSAVKFSGTEATATIAGILARTALQIPSNTFSWSCNHVLYGPRCKVEESFFQFVFNVDSVSADGVRLTLSDADSESNPQATITANPSYFSGGRMLTGVQGAQRMLISMTMDTPGSYTAILMVPSQGLEVGSPVTISAGCDRSIQTCYSRFNNSPNYGGFPFIPTLNPFATDIKREE